MLYLIGYKSACGWLPLDPVSIFRQINGQGSRPHGMEYGHSHSDSSRAEYNAVSFGTVSVTKCSLICFYGPLVQLQILGHCPHPGVSEVGMWFPSPVTSALRGDCENRMWSLIQKYFKNHRHLTNGRYYQPCLIKLWPSDTERGMGIQISKGRAFFPRKEST